MNEPLTEAAARGRIQEYLARTVESLPSGVGFSRTPDNDALGTLAAGYTVPCYNDHREHGRWQVQLRYWVVGIPAGQTDAYKDMLRAAWTRLGWRADPGATARLIGFGTPDRYTFVLQDAGRGDGSLSVTAASPCFPDTRRGGALPVQPDELRHP